MQRKHFVGADSIRGRREFPTPIEVVAVAENLRTAVANLPDQHQFLPFRLRYQPRIIQKSFAQIDKRVVFGHKYFLFEINSIKCLARLILEGFETISNNIAVAVKQLVLDLYPIGPTGCADKLDIDLNRPTLLVDPIAPLVFQLPVGAVIELAVLRKHMHPFPLRRTIRLVPSWEHYL